MKGESGLISSLPTGTYLVKVTSNNRIETFKIVKE
ncbi:hypothetical protein DB895_13465 [Flavobacterium psychrotolerans]|uniref:Secretion system C-terminal sorting domain-containing protein n=1 Tax=Flavobacterium psychrotolerans TaxID=2169410 RepID=A0A2U1JG07_9FLAO|nr:hypothetical protein DB895_13465 [Flavobacterium psychrotolerans]